MNIAHNFTIGAFENRAQHQRITDEWIVYREFNNQNYYLAIAAHDDGDKTIYKRVADAYELDFPFFKDTE